MGYFKYELQRGGGYMYTPDDLTWFERLLYRLQGYKVITTTDEYWKALEEKYDTPKETNINVEFKILS